MKRREFIKKGAGGLAALAVGSGIFKWLANNPAYAAKLSRKVLDFTVTDAIKNMVTHNAVHTAQCYMWIFKEKTLPPDAPGPYVFATSGEQITLKLKNDLDEPHAFYIKGMVNTGPVAPGQSIEVTFTAGPAGSYLYYDNLNEPVNRVMGLHGAFIVMPAAAVPGHNFTPYDNPPPRVQQLFDDLGSAPWWPGLAWEQGDPATHTPPFRQHIWVLSQASSKLFAEVGNHPAGQDYPAAEFEQKFLHDPFRADPFGPQGPNYLPQYFTCCGQSGHFSHNNPYICPNHRVGEPVVIRILNAGLWHHSTHIHANHIYVMNFNNQFEVVPGQQDNSIWVDVYTSTPLDTYDWLVPYMRPPDVPNYTGNGRADLGAGLPVIATPIPAPWGSAGGPTPAGQTTWPPVQELDMHIPPVGSEMAKDRKGNAIDLAVRLSPICYPMHDHSEPSQTSQGGNYNMGLISGMNYIGDRHGAGPGEPGVEDFMDPAEIHEYDPDYTQGIMPSTVPFVAM